MRNRYRLAITFVKKKIRKFVGLYISFGYLIKNTQLFKVHLSVKDLYSGIGSLNKVKLKYEIYL